MSFNDIVMGVGIGVVTTVISTGITFYVKDYLKERAKYQKFKAKLEQIAGKNAQVMIPQIGQGKVKIVDINKQGIEVESQLCKTFIPIDKLFQTEISVPFENYEKLAKELAVKTLREGLDVMFPAMMDKLKEMIVGEFLEPDSKLNAVVAFQIRSQLKQEGYAGGDESGEKTPSLKQLMNHFDKKGKGEKTGKTQEEKE